MFGSRRKTVIAKGLKIEGRVTAEGLVELNGQIEGELHGKSLIISRGALVKGAVSADQVVVDGTVEGPITGGEVTLKSRAHVIGDIHTDLSRSRLGLRLKDGRSTPAERRVTRPSPTKALQSQPARSLERRPGRTAMGIRVPAARGRHRRQVRQPCSPEPSLRPAASRLWRRGRVSGCAQRGGPPRARRALHRR